MKKRILSLILAVTMMLSMCCFTVGAETGDGYTDDGDWDDVQVLSVVQTDDTTFEVTFNKEVSIDGATIKLVDDQNEEIESQSAVNGTKLTVTATGTLGDKYAIVIYGIEGLIANATFGGDDVFYAPNYNLKPQFSIHIEPFSEYISLTRVQRIDDKNYTLAFTSPVNLANAGNVKVLAGEKEIVATSFKYVGSNAVKENGNLYSDFIVVTFAESVPGTNYIFKIVDGDDDKVNGYIDALVGKDGKPVKSTSNAEKDEIALGSPDLENNDNTVLRVAHDGDSFENYECVTPLTPGTISEAAFNVTEEEGITVQSVVYTGGNTFEVTFSEPVTVEPGTNCCIALRFCREIGGKISLDKTDYQVSGNLTKKTDDNSLVWTWTYAPITDTNHPLYRKTLADLKEMRVAGLEDGQYELLFDIEEGPRYKKNDDGYKEKVDQYPCQKVGYVEFVHAADNSDKCLKANVVKSSAQYEDCYIRINWQEENVTYPLYQDTQDLKLLKAEVISDNRILATFSEKVQFATGTTVFAGVRYCASTAPNLISIGANKEAQYSTTTLSATSISYAGGSNGCYNYILKMGTGLYDAMKGNKYVDMNGTVSPNIYLCLEGLPNGNNTFNNRVGLLDAITSEQNYGTTEAPKYKKLLATKGKHNNDGVYDGVYVPLTIADKTIEPTSAELDIANGKVVVEFPENITAADNVTVKIKTAEAEIQALSVTVSDNKKLVATFAEGADFSSVDKDSKLVIVNPSGVVETESGFVLPSYLSDDGTYAMDITIKRVTIESVVLNPTADVLEYTIKFSEPMHIFDPNCIHVTFNQDPKGVVEAAKGYEDQIDIIGYKGTSVDFDWDNCKGVVYGGNTEYDADELVYSDTITFKFDNKVLHSKQHNLGGTINFYPENAGIRFEEYRSQDLKDDSKFEVLDGKMHRIYFNDGLICNESIKSINGNSLKANCCNSSGCDIVWLPTQYWLKNYAPIVQSFNTVTYGENFEKTWNTDQDNGRQDYIDYFEAQTKIQVIDTRVPSLDKAIFVSDNKAILVFNTPVDLDVQNCTSLADDLDGKSRFYLATGLSSESDVVVGGYTAAEKVIGEEVTTNGEKITIKYGEVTIAVNENEDTITEFELQKNEDGTFSFKIGTKYLKLCSVVELKDYQSKFHIVKFGDYYRIYSEDYTSVFCYVSTFKLANPGADIADGSDLATVTITTSTPDVLYGDVTGDGKVNDSDFFQMAQWYLDKENIPLGPQN